MLENRITRAHKQLVERRFAEGGVAALRAIQGQAKPWAEQRIAEHEAEQAAKAKRWDRVGLWLGSLAAAAAVAIGILGRG